MALLPILEYPDKRLRQASQPIVEIDDAIRKLARDMAETMYAAPGVGLAAIQVGEPLQLIVIDTAEKGAPSDLMVLVNPKITERLGAQVFDEGCLSLPGISEEVTRAELVVVEYTDLSGQPQTVKATGIKAVCLQHEIDHLGGVLFTDHLSALKRKFTLRRVERFKREREEKAQEAAEAPREG